MLSKNWITEHTLDKEYKEHLLRGYLQKVSKKFDRSLLYPDLTELSEHYALLKYLEEVKRDIRDHFPKSLIGLDWEKMKSMYADTVRESSAMRAVQELVDYAIPRMFSCLRDGQMVHEFYKGQLLIESIGIAPLYNKEGYLLLLNKEQNCTMAYRYGITIYDHPEAPYQKVNTTYVASYKSGISTTDQSIKQVLIRNHQELPNPATYSIKADIPIPFSETMLPLAKELLVEYLGKESKTAD